MRNYARFHDKIEVFKTISVIKDLTCLVENSFKALMKNDMLDFNVIKFFCINTRSPCLDWGGGTVAADKCWVSPPFEYVDG